MPETNLGDRGEEIAAAFLEKRGYRILERNYRFERGEVDIVCLAPPARVAPHGEIVFVEVKARSGDRFGRPEESVAAEKQRRIIETARAYLYERKLEGAPCRFDVLSIVMRPAGPVIEHLEDAFWS